MEHDVAVAVQRKPPTQEDWLRRLRLSRLKLDYLRSLPQPPCTCVNSPPCLVRIFEDQITAARLAFNQAADALADMKPLPQENT